MEDARARELAVELNSLTKARGDLTSIVETQAHILNEASEKVKAAFRGDEIRPYFLYETYLSEMAVKKDVEILELGKSAETKRKMLEEAMKKRRVVDRLKERHGEALRAELNKAEQMFSDEVATNQAAMARPGSGKR
jgi:flagellar export protein FliJ